jgi:hypothetical protein
MVLSCPCAIQSPRSNNLQVFLSDDKGGGVLALAVAVATTMAMMMMVVIAAAADNFDLQSAWFFSDGGDIDLAIKERQKKTAELGRWAFMQRNDN